MPASTEVLDAIHHVGQVVTYTVVLTNNGNVTLRSPSVSDPGATLDCGTVPTIVAPGSLPATLAPGESVTCTASYTITLDDLNAGSVSNTASADAFFGDGTVSAEDTATIKAAIDPEMSLVKTSDAAGAKLLGDVVNFTYVLKNTGNVTLSGPFSVSDDKTTVVCTDAPASLAPGDSITCTSSYVITQADVDAGSVTNKATGHASYAEKAVNSAEQSVTVQTTKPAPPATPTPTPTQEIGGASATPSTSASQSQALLGVTSAPNATPPATNAANNSSGDSGMPLFALLIAVAFGSLAMLMVEKQRRAIRN